MTRPSHLPEDVRQWPDDPFALLGVDCSADERALRRAYSALIRIYKPEHAPEEFRRIRDAYETAAKYHRIWESPSAPEAFDPGEEPTGSSPLNTRSADPADLPPASRQTTAAQFFEDRVEKLCQEASAGRPQVAYQGFRDLLRQHPGNEELYLRLYWLATMLRDPDPPPAAWLAEALRNNGLSGRAWELYLRELANDPEEAASQRCDALLKSPAPIARLSDLAKHRWAGVDLRQRARVIAGDLAKLRDRFERDDHAAWGRLLLGAIDWLAWDPTRVGAQMLEACRREAEATAGTQLELSEEFARTDLLLELIEVCRRLLVSGNVRSDLVDLLREGWCRPYETVRSQLATYLRPRVENLPRGLREFDHAGRSGAAALYVLGGLIDRFHRERVGFQPPPEPSRLAGEINEFLAQQTQACSRIAILEFCLAAGISVQDFGRVLLANADDRPPNTEFAERLLGDASLHYLCNACRAFWA